MNKGIPRCSCDECMRWPRVCQRRFKGHPENKK